MKRWLPGMLALLLMVCLPCGCNTGKAILRQLNGLGSSRTKRQLGKHNLGICGGGTPRPRRAEHPVAGVFGVAQGHEDDLDLRVCDRGTRRQRGRGCQVRCH